MRVTKRDAYAEVASQVDELVAVYDSEAEQDEKRRAMVPYLREISSELWRKARPPQRERKAQP